MRVLLLTHGSRGDLQPYVALARELGRAGHTATLAASAEGQALAAAYGVPFVTLRDRLKEVLADPALRRARESNYRGLCGLRAQRLFRPVMTELWDDLPRLSRDGVDLLVYKPTLPGDELGEHLGIPAVPVGLQPIWVPTGAFPNPLVPYRLPKVMNRMSFRWTRWWVRSFTPDPVRWGADVLGPPVRQSGAAVTGARGADRIMLQAFSHRLLPEATDYPDWVRTTGFWFLPAPPDWTPPPELVRFLAAGPPPVYVGFGSMMGTDPDRTGRIVAEAVALAGVRAVVVAGWGGICLDHAAVPDVLVLPEAPFDWLLPRTAAIVHHGGSGTTGAALAAGRPQVLCPFLGEQPFFASRLEVLGVAPAPIPHRDLEPRRLADAIAHAVSDRTMVAKAAGLGRAVRAENGAATAVSLLAGLVPAGSSP